MARAFISHSSQDYDLVERTIVRPLREHGIDVWFSRDDIQIASVWEQMIRDALKACEWFILALTPNAITSEWVQAEVDWALDNRRGHVIPVLLETCSPADLHLKLPRIQHVDLRSNSDAERAKLIALLGVTPAIRATEGRMLSTSDTAAAEGASSNRATEELHPAAATFDASTSNASNEKSASEKLGTERGDSSRVPEDTTSTSEARAAEQDAQLQAHSAGGRRRVSEEPPTTKPNAIEQTSAQGGAPARDRGPDSTNANASQRTVARLAFTAVAASLIGFAWFALRDSVKPKPPAASAIFPTPADSTVSERRCMPFTIPNTLPGIDPNRPVTDPSTATVNWLEPQIVLEVLPGHAARLNSSPLREDDLSVRLSEVFDPRPEKVLIVVRADSATLEDLKVPVAIARAKKNLLVVVCDPSSLLKVDRNGLRDRVRQ